MLSMRIILAILALLLATMATAIDLDSTSIAPESSTLTTISTAAASSSTPSASPETEKQPLCDNFLLRTAGVNGNDLSANIHSRYIWIARMKCRDKVVFHCDVDDSNATYGSVMRLVDDPLTATTFELRTGLAEFGMGDAEPEENRAALASNAKWGAGKGNDTNPSMEKVDPGYLIDRMDTRGVLIGRERWAAVDLYPLPEDRIEKQDIYPIHFSTPDSESPQGRGSYMVCKVDGAGGDLRCSARNWMWDPNYGFIGTDREELSESTVLMVCPGSVYAPHMDYSPRKGHGIYANSDGKPWVALAPEVVAKNSQQGCERVSLQVVCGGAT